MLDQHFFANFTWTVILLLVLSPSLAKENDFTPGSTLEEFFNSSIQFSPDLRIAEENLKIGSARKKAADALLLPQVNAGVSVSDNRLYQLDQLRTFHGERYYLGLSQTLFNWQQFASRKRARFDEDRLEEEYYYELATLLSEVSNRYFSVLEAQDTLDSNASEIEALSNQLDQVRSLYDIQLSQITDLYQVQASLAAVEAQRLQLNAELALNQESLRSISGIEVGTLFRLNDNAEIPELELSQKFYVDQAIEKNHQVLANKFALKAAEEGVSQQKGSYMPQISIIAQRQDSDVGFDNLPINRTDTTYIGLNVQIPIYSGGRNKAGLSEAYSTRNIAEYELRASELRVRELVRSAYLQTQAGSARTNAARILVESTTLAAEAMQQGFSLGTVTSVDVLNSLRDQFQAERDLQRIRYDHIRYLMLLKREAGTLSAEDLLEVSSLLVPPPAE